LKEARRVFRFGLVSNRPFLLLLLEIFLIKYLLTKQLVVGRQRRLWL
jgi:hypothetical protein